MYLTHHLWRRSCKLQRSAKAASQCIAGGLLGNNVGGRTIAVLPYNYWLPLACSRPRPATTTRSSTVIAPILHRVRETSQRAYFLSAIGLFAGTVTYRQAFSFLKFCRAGLGSRQGVRHLEMSGDAPGLKRAVARSWLCKM